MTGHMTRLVVSPYGAKLWTHDSKSFVVNSTMVCSESFIYIKPLAVICFKLFKQFKSFAWCLAEPKAGSSNAARMAMMVMTTNSSIKVKPVRDAIPIANLVAWKVFTAWWVTMAGLPGSEASCQ